MTEADVQTPAELYAELAADGYDVAYARVPVTDEKAPKGDDFEALLARLWGAPPGAAVVFNCQMGRGRTTTGMALGCLLALRRARGALAPPPPAPLPGLPAWYALPPPVTAAAAAAGAAAPAAASPEAAEEAELRAGRFGAVRSLLRALPRGREAKAALDLALDACAAMQNLREAVAGYRARLAREPNDGRRAELVEVRVFLIVIHF